MFFFSSPGGYFILFVLLLSFSIYLIRRYIYYKKLESKKTTEIKITNTDLKVAVLLLVIGSFPLLRFIPLLNQIFIHTPLWRYIPWFSLSFPAVLFVFVAVVFSIIFLIKRNKIYKIYGEEIRKQEEEREKQQRQKEGEKGRIRRKKDELRKKTLMEQNSLRIVGKVAILLVVLGFFMPIITLPILGGQNGFEFAEFATNTGNFVSALEGIENAEKKGANLSTSLYVCFVSSLIGGLLIIPLIMKKRFHILFDIVPLLVSGICWFFAYFGIKDYVKLQIGGVFIFAGLIASLIVFLAIVGKMKSATKYIPLSTGKEVGETKKCVKCGQKISVDLFVCPNCRGEEFE